MEYRSVSRSSRRKFLFAGFVASVGRATTYAQQQAPIPETLTQWLGASAKMRKLALQRCLDRIQTMEPLIHAWVQVSPQRNTSRGRLSGIPYGVKDIVETRGLATEYGSPIYKGRIGTTDAAIIREMRKHGAILLGKTQTTAFAYQTPAPTRTTIPHLPPGCSRRAGGKRPWGVRERTGGPDPKNVPLGSRVVSQKVNFWGQGNKGRLTSSAVRRRTGEYPAARLLLPGGLPATGGKQRAVDHAIEHDLVMVAREALSNAVRHAAPTSVQLRLSFGTRELKMQVDDDGHGFDPASSPANGHYGIIGMRERIEHLGGKFVLRSGPGEGTHLEVDVPLTKRPSTPAANGGSA